MRRRKEAYLAVFVLLLQAFGLSAGVGGSNPYTAIVSRNMFGLRPKAQVHASAPLPPIEVYVSGIYRFRGTNGVLFEVIDKAAGQKRELVGPLREGEVRGRISITAIQPRKGAVVISIDGREQTLTLEKNAPKRTASVFPVNPTPAAVAAQRAFRSPAIPQFRR